MTERRIDEATVYSVPAHVLARRAADETVLLDVETEAYFTLDHVGTRVFDLVRVGSSFGDLIDTIETEYDVPRADLIRDVSSLLSAMCDRGLLVITGA